MAKNISLNLEFNPQYLARIVNTAVVTSTEIVNAHFDYLAKADLSKPVELAHTQGMGFRFNGAPFDAEQRRALHENWILAKAFQDLLRAVRHALEEAHVLVSILNKPHSIKSDSTLNDFLQPFRSKAASMRFPDLLEKVNQKLEPALDFSDSYLSLQTARNCLEHRNGIVTNIETHDKNTFDFSVPRMKLFYLRNGEEIELRTGDIVKPDEDKDHAEIMMKLERRQLSVALGDRLRFTLSDFNEVAFACHYLGNQLAQKLPSPN